MLTDARSSAAVVRSLLNEFERIAFGPPVQGERRGGTVGDQLVEELARLGCRMVEVAAVMASKR